MASLDPISVALKATEDGISPAGKIASFLEALPTKFTVTDEDGNSRLYVVDLTHLAHAVRMAGNPNFKGGGNAPNNTPGGTPVSGGNRAPEYFEYERMAA